MITSPGVDNGTPGRRNAWGFDVPSLTSTINVVDDWWHPLLVRQTFNYFYFPTTRCQNIRELFQNANKPLFSNDRIRYSATRSRRKLAIANTRSEHFNIRDQNDGRKQGRLIQTWTPRKGARPSPLICMCLPRLKFAPRHVASCWNQAGESYLLV